MNGAAQAVGILLDSTTVALNFMVLANQVSAALIKAKEENRDLTEEELNVFRKAQEDAHALLLAAIAKSQQTPPAA